MSDKYWQYRVMAHVDETNEIYFKIHEVQFDSNGDAVSYCETPTTIGSETIEGLKWVIDQLYLVTHAVGSMVPRNRIIWAGENFPMYYDFPIIINPKQEEK